MEIENQQIEKSLCTRIFHRFLISNKKKVNFSELYEKFPENIKLIEILDIIKKISGTKEQDPFFIIHFDETQELINWNNENERKKSYIYQISQLLQGYLFGSNRNHKFIYVFTGLNTLKMKDFCILSGNNIYKINLQLLNPDHMIGIIDELLKTDEKHSNDSNEDLTGIHQNLVFKKFLELQIGVPRLFE
jgi:hypothetical protein